MFDTDTMLMRRALGLARRGAGLVSPNPMVGAVLVKDGHIVGEGYHRFDLLKHAEAYAIEMAGEKSGGATLYCTLEPCSHHGRTPPCTDALIEAKIARAVIAAKDPDRRVNGRGIDLLRDAGIEVEVGLLEEDALRLNENYLKFIARGVPFVHGVIEYASDGRESSGDWRPSDEFLQVASEYDALMLGSSHRLNKLALRTAVRHERHRQLVVVSSEPELLRSLRRRIVHKVSVVPFEARSVAEESSGKVVSLDEANVQGTSRSKLGTLLATLVRMNVTSLLILPGIVDPSDVSNFKELDKATIVVRGEINEQYLAAPWAFDGGEFDLIDVTIVEAGGFTELTGYPSLRGVA